MPNWRMKEYLSSNYTGDHTHDILQFDPAKVSGMEKYGSMTHVVVYQSETKDKNGSVIKFTVFDPQRGESYDIPFNSVMDILHVGGSGSSYSSSGSSSYYGSSNGSSNGSSGSSSYYGSSNGSSNGSSGSSSYYGSSGGSSNGSSGSSSYYG